jgi:hypothetical protein
MLMSVYMTEHEARGLCWVSGRTTKGATLAHAPVYLMAIDRWWKVLQAPVAFS